MSPSLHNTVIVDRATNCRYRIVQIKDGVLILFQLPTDPHSQCRTLNFCDYPVEQVQKWLDTGKLKILENHPYHPAGQTVESVVDGGVSIPENSLILRDRRLALLKKALPEDLSFFLEGGIIQHFIKVCKEHGGSRTGLAKIVGLWFTFGMVDNALLPSFCLCGGRGKAREAGEAKRGAPPLVEGLGGVNITPELAQQIDDHCLDGIRKGVKSVPVLYQTFVEKYGVDGKEVGDHGEIKTRFLPPHMQVHPDSFEKRFHQIDYKTKMIGWWGERQWTNKFRETLGSEAAFAQLPGAYYQLDFSRVNVLCRHPLYGLPIGRGTLGASVDVGSTMIPGLRFSMANPSTQESFLLLECTFLPKVPYCRRHGFDIEPEEWPAEGFCSVACADNGEFGGVRPIVLPNNFHITLQNERIYSPTDKGTMERLFRHIEEHELQFLPGHYPKHRQVGEAKSPLDGVLSPQALQQILILALLKRLKERVEDRYMPIDAIRQKCPPTALDLWLWSLRRGLGALGAVPNPDLLRLAFLPSENAYVKGNGLAFKKLTYVNAELNRMDFFSKHKGKGRWVKVVFEPNLIDCIYVVMKDKVYPCELAQEDKAMHGGQGYSFEDIAEILREMRKGRLIDRPQKLQRDSDHRALINHIIARETDMAKHQLRPVEYSIGGGAPTSLKFHHKIAEKAYKKAEARELTFEDAPGASANGALKLLPPADGKTPKVAPAVAKEAPKATNPGTEAKTQKPKQTNAQIEYLRKLYENK